MQPEVRLISSADLHVGKCWPWSKRRWVWRMVVDSSKPATIEVTCSWRSKKVRVYLNGNLITETPLSALPYTFKYRDIPLTFSMSGSTGRLLIEGIPVAWFYAQPQENEQLLDNGIRPAGYHSLEDEDASSTSIHPTRLPRAY